MTTQRHARYKESTDERSLVKDTQVWYHRACQDGFGAAWAAWMKFGDGAEYVPLQYGDKTPSIPEGTREVYLLDFSFKRDVMLHLLDITAQVGVKLVMLDHHRTAADELAGVATTNGLYIIRIDESKSGAVLAWEYFHPRWPIPELLLFVQDRDLWQWKLLRSKEFSVWLQGTPFAFDEWSLIASKLEHGYRDEIFTEAGAMKRLVDAQVDRSVKHAWVSRILGFEVPVVNTTLHQSEIGDALCHKYQESPFSASYWDRPEGDRVWSLRSRNGFDCQGLARRVIGGGGHPGAAGFRSTRLDYVTMADGRTQHISE